MHRKEAEQAENTAAAGSKRATSNSETSAPTPTASLVSSGALSSLWSLTLLAFGIKGFTLIIDPNPQFFLGDSGSYLHTAVSGWIPPDRSYLYGFVIRWLCLGSGSLFPLLLTQTLASSFSAGILGWSVQRFLQTPRSLTVAVTIAYSLDPLQLMYDRFVMAESFSLCAAMIFIGLLLVFLQTGNRWLLILASVAGVFAVALRISFLPLVAVLSFSAPLIRFFWTSTAEHQEMGARLKALSYSLLVVGISHFALHTSYKVLTGKLAGGPPAYQYADGFSLLSSWSPLLTTSDLQAAGAPDQILNGTYPRTLEGRRAQRWMEKGIVLTLTGAYPDLKQANAMAKKIAFQILRRDPTGVAELGIRTYLRGWRRDVIRGCIKEDAARDRPITPGLIEMTRKRFHLAAADMPVRWTWTKSYFARGTEWYRVLLLTPLLLVATVPFANRKKRMFMIFVSIYAAVAMLTAVGLAVDNSIRYLHPLSWTFFVLLAFWIMFFFNKARGRGSRTLPLAAAILTASFFSALSPSSEAAASPGLYVSNGTLMRQGQPYVGIGANYNSLFGKLLQNGNDRSTLTNLARLAKAGIPFVRYRACGFGSENYQLYLQDRKEYFRRMDLVVRAAEENHIGLIPSLFWRLATISEVVNESRDQLGNPNGRANQFIRQYTKEMVERYKDSPAIWGWEFGNEANLGVDLGKGGLRKNPTALFKSGRGLSSQQLRVPFTIFAQTARNIDSRRMIESGTASPRPAAWHMARGQAGPDNAEQSFSSLLNITPDPMNMISIHVYEKAKDHYPWAKSIVEVLTTLRRSAAAAGKPLFLGEFPVRNRTQAQEFLEAIKAARVPLSAFWVFDLPAQEASMSVSFTNQRAFVIDMVAKANRALQAQ